MKKRTSQVIYSGQKVSIALAIEKVCLRANHALRDNIQKLFLLDLELSQLAADQNNSHF